MVQLVRLLQQLLFHQRNVRTDLTSVMIMLSGVSAGTLMSSEDWKCVWWCSVVVLIENNSCTLKRYWTDTPCPFSTLTSVLQAFHAWVVIMYDQDKEEICLYVRHSRKERSRRIADIFSLYVCITLYSKHACMLVSCSLYEAAENVLLL